MGAYPCGFTKNVRDCNAYDGIRRSVDYGALVNWDHVLWAGVKD